MSLINEPKTRARDFKLSTVWGTLQKIKNGKIADHGNYEDYLIGIGLNVGEISRILELFWEDGGKYLPE
jgi:hypothetical protein